MGKKSWGNLILSGILTGGLSGSLLGLAVSSQKIGVLNLPGLASLFASFPVDPSLTTPVLGSLIGGGIGGIVGYALYRNSSIVEGNHTNHDWKPDIKAGQLLLRQEQLDIIKKSIKTGSVSLQKEVISEDKIFTVPVTREELMVKVTHPNSSGPSGEPVEMIRIPLSEERVEITKRPVILEDVFIYRREFQEIERIEETLRREIAHVEAHGECQVVETEKQKGD